MRPVQNSELAEKLVAASRSDERSTTNDADIRFAEDPHAYHIIFNSVDGKVMQASDWAGTQPFLAPLIGSPDQRWNIVPAGGYYRISSQPTGLCLESDSTEEAGIFPVRLYPSKNTGGQLWSLKHLGGPDYKIANIQSGMVLQSPTPNCGNADVTQDWESPDLPPDQRWSIARIVQ